MNVTLCSAFRNSIGVLERYFRQVTELQQALGERGDSLHLILGEGDSRDGTLASLTELSTLFSVEIVDCTHGGTEYGSVINEQRFRQLAHVANTIFSVIPTDSDAVLWVESDLIWEANTILALLDRLEDYPAISPMIYLRRNRWPEYSFYDTYAFRLDGIHFGHYPPYHPKWNANEVFSVDSAGSCMAFHGELARQIMWDEGVFPGACEQVYALGGSVWVDPTLGVFHE